MTQVYDYEEHKEPPKLGDNSMARLYGLAQKQKEAEALVTALQKQLADAQTALDLIAGKELPELMQELRLSDFTLDNGTKITIKESIHTSIPKARQDDAFKWLEDHGHSGVIKRQFKIAFNRDEEAWANKFQADLAKRKKPVNAVIERKVEPPTLKALVTRELEAGKTIPQDLFGVHRRKLSTVEVKS
jgi:hypothetical protein